MSSLCWFRHDLRVDDQPALSAAASESATMALYIATPEQWRMHGDAGIKVDFWLRAVHALKDELAALNIPLKWLIVEKWSEVPEALLQFCTLHQIDSVHCNREHGFNERQRDRAAYSLLKDHGIRLTGHHGGTLLSPGSVKTGADQFYRVFTPFSKACKERLRSAPYRLSKAPIKQNSGRLPFSDTLPDQMPGWSKPAPHLLAGWPATSQEAACRLQNFIENKVSKYQASRDFPAIAGTSTLSPYLAAGLISAGQCLYAAMQVNQGEAATGDAGVVTWINEILWREFYQHLIYGYPGLSKHQPMRPDTNHVVWRQAPEELNAWCEARTGVPIIDAAMRQLVQTGWMHNRLRMIVAMYLTKNLLIDWRLGEAFFMRHLIDREIAANNGGWQWSASTGADAAPYFRVFNPVSQSEKFDPEGQFIRFWVPELASLNNKQIHDPDVLSRKRLAYPLHLVDLKTSRLRAIDAFSSLKF